MRFKICELSDKLSLNKFEKERMIKQLLKRAKREERTMRAATGVSIRQFTELGLFFHEVLISKANKKNRKRVVGGGRKGILRGVEEKVFFILFYLKVYPTYDLASMLFQADRSQPCRWVKLYFPILEAALGRTLSLPKRKVSSMEEFQEVFRNVYDVLVDVTERKCQRPSSSKNLKRRYSGKKKIHTRKNTLMVDEGKHIRVISPTRNGRTHDFTLFKKEGISHCMPEGYSLWLDKGYTGIESLLPDHAKAYIPKRKSKKIPLTPLEKSDNKVISSLRMPVEHAIGGMKRYGCMQTPIRNKSWYIEDKMPLLCAGLWNFHLDRR
ncbi:MAG: transposase [Bacteroidetes bacterium]|nr:transposase [Bacteroidota bacterium]